MKESTRRSLRTLYHGLIGLLAAVPVILAVVPEGALAAKLAVVLAATAAASKALNALEDAGLIPAWLKDDATTP